MLDIGQVCIEYDVRIGSIAAITVSPQQTVNVAEIVIPSFGIIQARNDLEKEQNLWGCNSDNRIATQIRFNSTLEDMIETNQARFHPAPRPCPLSG